MYLFGPEVNEWVAAFNNATNTVNSSITTAVTSASIASTAASTASAALAQMVAAVNGSTIYPPQLVTSMYNPTAGLPSAPVVGQAHVATATANGWTSGRIYKRAAASWTEYIPPAGWLVLDVSMPAYWRFDGATWVRQVTAANVSIGINADQVPTWAMLGTAACLDQTWLYASVTWDAASCASGSQVSTTVLVPGADVGDYVLTSCVAALSGLALRGEVTAQDVVTIYLFNGTGASVDMASVVYNIRVVKLTYTR